MKAEYDKETDTLTITLRDARVKESDEIRPGVIADFGYDGGVVGFEVLQASKVVEKRAKCSSQSLITDNRLVAPYPTRRRKSRRGEHQTSNPPTDRFAVGNIAASAAFNS